MPNPHEKVPVTNWAEYLMILIIDKKCQDAPTFGWKAQVCAEGKCASSGK
jgi:hypothetical protein